MFYIGSRNQINAKKKKHTVKIEWSNWNPSYLNGMWLDLCVLPRQRCSKCIYVTPFPQIVPLFESPRDIQVYLASCTLV